MSGHNKWSKIRHKKAATDAKRGKVFSKLAQQISITARDGGGDADVNPSLRMLLNKAREVSMPSDNVDRAIKKGTGEGGDGNVLENATYEGFGPDKVAIIVEVLTDNKNRAVSELRKLFGERGGSLGEAGSVSWNFSPQGLITVRPAKMEKAQKFGQDDVAVEEDPEEVMLSFMDIDGILDIKVGDEDGVIVLEVYSEPTKFGSVRDSIVEMKYLVQNAELAHIANNTKDMDSVDIEKVSNFVDAIEEYPDVVSVWTDLE